MSDINLVNEGGRRSEKIRKSATPKKTYLNMYVEVRWVIRMNYVKDKSSTSNVSVCVRLEKKAHYMWVRVFEKKFIRRVPDNMSKRYKRKSKQENWQIRCVFYGVFEVERACTTLQSSKHLSTITILAPLKYINI